MKRGVTCLKKTLAVILAATLIFLCACTGKETTADDITKQTAATLPKQDNEEKNESTAEGWVTEMLPEKFAKQPDGSIAISTQKLDPAVSKSPYNSAAVRLKLRCLPEQMQAFSKELVSLGYTGCICFYKNHAVYQSNVVGNWTNDEYFVTVNEFELSTAEKDDLQYTITIDVVKCKNDMPDILTRGFPDLKNVWTRKAGNYQGVNSFGVETIQPDSTLSDTYWLWEFKGQDAFIGVSREEYTAYLYELTTRGFDGYSEIENDEYGEIEYYSSEYTYGGNVYGVYLCYISYMSTLEMIFSNSIKNFYDE